MIMQYLGYDHTHLEFLQEVADQIGNLLQLLSVGLLYWKKRSEAQFLN